MLFSDVIFNFCIFFRQHCFLISYCSVQFTGRKFTSLRYIWNDIHIIYLYAYLNFQIYLLFHIKTDFMNSTIIHYNLHINVSKEIKTSGSSYKSCSLTNSWNFDERFFITSNNNLSLWAILLLESKKEITKIHQEE